MKTAMSSSDFRFVLNTDTIGESQATKPHYISTMRITRPFFLVVLKTSPRRKRNRSNIPLQRALSITDFTSQLWELELKNKRSKPLLSSRFIKRKAMQKDGQVDPVLSMQLFQLLVMVECLGNSQVTVHRARGPHRCLGLDRQRPQSDEVPALLCVSKTHRRTTFRMKKHLGEKG